MTHEQLPPPAPLGFWDGLLAFVIPLYGLFFGLKCLFREQVGWGIGLLVLAALGTAAWELVVRMVA